MADRTLNLTSDVALGKDERFQFARNHALSLYNKKIIYSYIPKNACSSFRYIISRENGCVSSPLELSRVQNNNSTFSATLEQLATANYTFVLLRCPYRRAVSAFLDKSTTEPWRFWRLRAGRHPDLRLILNKVSSRVFNTDRYKFNAFDDGQFTFIDFLKSFQNIDRLNSDHHWRSQVDFMVYKNYDDVFCVERMDTCIAQFKKRTGIDYIDTRLHTNHSTSAIESVDYEGAFDLSVRELRKMRESNKVPSLKSMLGEEAVCLIGSVYRDDIELYKRHYPDEIFAPGGV